MLFDIGMQELLLVLIVLAITVALLAVIGKKAIPIPAVFLDILFILHRRSYRNAASHQLFGKHLGYRYVHKL